MQAQTTQTGGKPDPVDTTALPLDGVGLQSLSTPFILKSIMDRLNQHALAGAYEANGKIAQAIDLLEHVVAAQERTLAEEHPSRLASQHALAGAYAANGQIKKAVEILEQVVTVKERTLAEKHSSRLASQHALACAYQANGQIAQAMKLLEHVVMVEGRTLAKEHPSRLASQRALAQLLLQISL
jgi:tetratricopeptide (TPR) repeat protein